jgi:uncharacterized damage-inducible protein DinB
MRDLDDATFIAALDGQRRAVLGKVAGIDRETAEVRRTASGTTIAGVLHHLVVVERDWFGHLFAGGPDRYGDLEDDFAPPAGLTLDDLVGEYVAACRESAAVVAAAPSFDAVSTLPHPFFGHVTLRWLHMHLLRETARHAGHLDILREETDGQVGDDAAPDTI